MWKVEGGVVPEHRPVLRRCDTALSQRAHPSRLYASWRLTADGRRAWKIAVRMLINLVPTGMRVAAIAEPFAVEQQRSGI